MGKKAKPSSSAQAYVAPPPPAPAPVAARTSADTSTGEVAAEDNAKKGGVNSRRLTTYLLNLGSKKSLLGQ